ncbi:MAG: L,D-transpeptidase family protein [Acidobacteria bacterium]|nr:L,D-transpeptidase family protein [Acidobacteriota bacterium]
MRNRTPLALALLSLACAGARPHVAAGKVPAPLSRSRQIVVVTTRDWDGVAGVLRRFERRGARGAWARVGAEVPVVVGRTGLAWGVGLIEAVGTDGPRKREGDGKAPAGVFRLGPAFGFAPARAASRLRLPYKPLAPTTECVDDPASRHYNRVVDGDALKAVDWNSSELMREVEGYRWGLVVAHNAAPPAPGLGSCIFLHVWAGPGKGTAGCTAMGQANLEALLRWLDSSKTPLLVQLPEAEYARLRGLWRLPPPPVVVK